MTEPAEAILAPRVPPRLHVHGEAHWRAVAKTGQQLVAAGTRADSDIAFWFGWLHDPAENGSGDPEHSPRAAAFARELHADGLLHSTTGS